MFGRRVTLFKLFGFAIRLDASWLIIAALVTWSLAIGYFPYYYPGLRVSTYWWMGIAGALLLFLSIVVHELFHSLVARRYGIPMNGITLFLFGGIAEMDREPPNAKSEFLMAIAGPLASVGIGLLFYLLYRAGNGVWPVQVVAVLSYISTLNWILAAFNMVPAFPLDGGRVFRAALWHWRGDLRSATRTSSALGSAFGFLLMFLAILQLFAGNFMGAVWWFVIGMFLRMVSQNAYSQVLMKSVLEGEPVRRFMNPEVDTVTPDISIEELVNDHIYRHHHKMVPVITDSETLAGCVSTDQVKQVPRDQWSTHTVADILEPCSIENTVTPETDSMEALKKMANSGKTKLMVLDGKRLMAVITLRDLMQFLTTKLELEGEPGGRKMVAGPQF
jgi:Zn-dependent protease/predicted transcriptional regulator